MEKGENFRDNIFKHWFGVSGEFDEYKHQEVNRIAANAFILYFPGMLLSLVAAGIFAVKDPEMTLAVLLLGQLGYFVLVVCTYIMFASRRAHLTDNEIDVRTSKQAYRRIIRKGLSTGVYFAIFMYLEQAVVNLWFDGTSLTQSLTQSHVIWVSIWSGVGMGILIGIQEIIRLRKFR